jgi:hypothetical protein
MGTPDKTEKERTEMLKKNLFLGLSVVLIVVAVSMSAQATSWTDKKSGFSITAVKGWRFYGNDIFTKALMLDREEAGYPFVMIDVKPRKKGQNLVAVVQDYLTNDFLNEEGAKNLKASADTEYDPFCADVQGYQAFYTTLMQKQPVDIHHYFFVKKNTYVVITIMNKKGEYKKYQKQLKSLLATFKVDGTNPKFKGL